MSWKDTLKKNIFGEDPDELTDFMNVTPRLKAEAERRKARRTSTKDSIGQDEEAAKRTEDEEAELLARLRERNRVAREKANEPVEKLVEWVHG
tara:strand:+ start:64 stop:342 length:279 start_codon:yes stop_codon:yes gene_type:complete